MTSNPVHETRASQRSRAAAADDASPTAGRRRLVGATLGAGLMAGLGWPHGAVSANPGRPAALPTGTLKIFVGFPPGGTTDVLGRLVGRELAEAYGVTSVIENRPGVSGGIAAAAVARSVADGTHLLFVSSTHGTNPSLYSTLPYDTERDLAPVAMVAATPYVLTAHPELGVSDFPGLIRYLKANPGKVNYASASPGTGQHLAGELLGRMAGVDIVHVPYKGSSAALPDVLSGRIQMTFENVAVMTPHVRRGSLRPIAVTGPHRSALLPDVPTVAESGLAGFEVLGWFAVLAPAATPGPVIDALNAAVQTVIAAPAFKTRLADIGADPIRGTAADARGFIDREIAKWREVIRAAGIVPS